MKRLFGSIGCVSFLICGFTSIGQPLAAPANERYIVALAPGNHPVDIAAAHGIAARQVYTHVLNGFAADIPPGRLIALAKDPRVESIAIDNEVFAFGKPGSGSTQTPAQVIPEGVKRIGAKLSWDDGNTGVGVGVAILDTGLDFNHADLRANIAGASFVSPDFTYTTSAQDDNGHGTHVGGIVAAVSNSVDVVGVAPGATLYAVKVLNNQGSGYDSDIIAGLDWVADNAGAVSPAIRVVNMSLGRAASSDDSAMEAAIQAVTNAGVTVVVAAGNDSSEVISNMVPAGFPEVIAVASTTAKDGTSNMTSPIKADTASYFTTDGLGVAISAPGEDQEKIKYPRISSVGILSTKLGGGTTRMSGTSMASPHVAGAVALLLGKYSSLTPAVIKDRLSDRAQFNGTAPLNSPTTSYTFDGEREGILFIPGLLLP